MSDAEGKSPDKNSILARLQQINAWQVAITVLLSALVGAGTYAYDAVSNRQRNIDESAYANTDVIKRIKNLEDANLASRVGSCESLIATQGGDIRDLRAQVYGGGGIKGLRNDMIDVDQRFRDLKYDMTQADNNQASVEKSDISGVNQTLATWAGRWDYLRDRLPDQSIPIVTKRH